MHEKHVALRWILRWLSRLSLLALITPFIWLEVDPLRSELARMNVTDVWILGGCIIGKDRFWLGILIAWIVQALGIFLFYALIRQAERQWEDLGQVQTPLCFASILLVAFPFWMELYVTGVINNSDGVHFIKHYGIGWVVYASSVYLIVRLFMRVGERVMVVRG